MNFNLAHFRSTSAAKQVFTAGYLEGIKDSAAVRRADGGLDIQAIDAAYRAAVAEKIGTETTANMKLVWEKWVETLSDEQAMVAVLVANSQNPMGKETEDLGVRLQRATAALTRLGVGVKLHWLTAVLGQPRYILFDVNMILEAK